MKQELILVADRLENIKCSTHAKSAKIAIVGNTLQISCCCKKHEQFLERQVEYEMYKLLNKENEVAVEVEVLPILKHAV